ncbi:hypothetical protein ACP70R_025721 [Stipagrostis hirtigluma subsp. patula]
MGGERKEVGGMVGRGWRHGVERKWWRLPISIRRRGREASTGGGGGGRSGGEWWWVAVMCGGQAPQRRGRRRWQASGGGWGREQEDGGAGGGGGLGVTWLNRGHLKAANAASGVAVSEECKARFQELRTARAHRFVVFKIDDSLQQVVVDKVGPRDAGFDGLTASLPADDCRYAVYDHDFTVGDATAAGEAPRSKIFFISWSPATAEVKSKMVYASSNEGFKKELDGVQIDLQATEPSELTLDVLKDHTT